LEILIVPDNPIAAIVYHANEIILASCEDVTDVK
jgi:hypothetical protein